MPHGAVRTQWVDVRFLFKTAREQPGESPHGSRECDVTEALLTHAYVYVVLGLKDYVYIYIYVCVCVCVFALDFIAAAALGNIK